MVQFISRLSYVKLLEIANDKIEVDKLRDEIEDALVIVGNVYTGGGCWFYTN